MYFFVQLIGLERFPFVHSDETWLSGLSRYILKTGQAGETEPYFNLFERHPHALRFLFQGIQMLTIKIFGYSIASVRGVSLLFGAAALLPLYLLVRRMTGEKLTAGTAVFLLAFQIDVDAHESFCNKDIQPPKSARGIVRM